MTIAENTVTGGWTIPSFQYGIEIANDAAARVIGNDVTANVCGGPFCGPDPVTEVQGTGILLLAVAGPVEVSGNRVAQNEVGVYQVFSPDCCTISGNRLRENAIFGMVIQDGDGRASGNVIAGGAVGIGVVADAVDTTAEVRGNSITGTSVTTVQEIECYGFKATAVLTRP